MVAFAIGLLLAATLTIMLYSAKKAVRKEALYMAQQTTEYTTLKIDNTLKNVEEATRLMLWNVEHHLDNPAVMYEYSRKMLEQNPHIIGCAIAFDPGFYKGRDRYFMAYSFYSENSSSSLKKDAIVKGSFFGNAPYPKQIWYSVPYKTDQPYWTPPLSDPDPNGNIIISYCLPIHGKDGQTVGVLAVDLPLKWFAAAIHTTKPSPNSYSLMVDKKGTIIIPPAAVQQRLLNDTTMCYFATNSLAQTLARIQDGYEQIKRKDNDYYIFSKKLDSFDWYVGVVYPAYDILDEYYHLRGQVIAILVVSILTLFVLCLLLTYRQLHPLQQLNRLAQHIANGHFNESMPHTKQDDEIGQLQDHFLQMQQSLSERISQLKQLSASLEHQGEVLREAYGHAQEADHLKTAFLHHITEHIVVPVMNILADVEMMSANHRHMSHKENMRVVNNILHQGQIVTSLLNKLLDDSLKETEESND